MKKNQYVPTLDFDTISFGGGCKCGTVGTAVNGPVTQTGAYIVIPLDTSGNVGCVFYIVQNTNKLYFRFKWDSWSNWKEISFVS